MPATSSSSGLQTPPSLKTSPRFASMTGTPPAKADSVDEPATGTSSARARPRAVASAIRIEVKLPGPVPTTIASMRRGSSTTSSISAISAEGCGVHRALPPVSAATAPAEVAQSKDKIVCGLDADTAVRLVEVRDGDGGRVAVADRVRRARHRLLDAERAAGAADEGRLAGAELAGDRDDVAERERGGESRPELLRLGGRGGVGHHGRHDRATSRGARG